MAIFFSNRKGVLKALNARVPASLSDLFIRCYVDMPMREVHIEYAETDLQLPRCDVGEDMKNWLTRNGVKEAIWTTDNKEEAV